MSQLRNARHKLEMAEHAAIDGDFLSADELLRDAARIQEAELGPLHPDLANTLNNLAIVAEKTGRSGDAETFYRRAVAIVVASLPADHPMVEEARQNLEAFCREHALPIAAAPAMTPSVQEPAPTVSPPQLPAPDKSSRRLEWVAIGAIVLVTAAVLLKRPWSSPTPSVAVPAATRAAEPAPPPLAMPAPIEHTQPPKAVPRGDARDVADRPTVSAPSSSAISLTLAQLCQAFSTSGSTWRCDAPGDSVAPGAIVLYTRVRSSRDSAVVHRWYHEDVLQQAVKLTIRANASEGYRTYSRQTVDGVGNWRVEVRSADGDLLHEAHFVVR